MSSPIEVRTLIPHQRNSDGPDAVAADGPDAVDDRGFVRAVTADLDMGAWFDPGTRPNTESSDRF